MATKYTPRQPIPRNTTSVKKKRVIKLPKKLILGILILGGFFAFAGMRHTQNCAYDGIVRNNQAINEWNTNLCPNILDPSNWGQFLINAINPFTISAVKANDARIGQLSTKVECTSQLDPMCLIGDNNASLKNTDGYTNILVVGVDSRSGHEGIANTDSMMLISYQQNTGNTLLLSFPRDLYITYARSNGTTRSSKINAVYAADGTTGLDNVIQQITAKPIHYHLYLNVETFAKIVDELGGIKITLDKDFKDAYPCAEVPAGKTCPNPRFIEDADYGLFQFSAGEQTFSGFDALVYTRARKYSSDFDRAARQQKLVKAIIHNVMSDNSQFLSNIGKYLQLYNSFKTDIKTNIELKDIAGALKIAGNLNDKVARVVVDPNLDNGKIVTRGGIINGAWSNKFKDPTYQQFQEYLNKVWTYLPYYIDTPKVLVINQSGAPIPADSPLGKFIAEQNPYRQIKVVEGIAAKGNGLSAKIYQLVDGKNSSVNDIQAKLPGSLVLSKEIDGITKTPYGEDVVIYYLQN